MMNSIPDVSLALPWQAAVWEQLGQQFGDEQLPHALLLNGVEHCGKTQLAMALARLLLCKKPVAGHNCGSCHACELSRSGSHGDFQWLAPEGTSRVIKVDQVRALVEFVTRTASLGTRKVAVINPAESMHRSSANALLKSLEEPSPDTYIILVCHQAQGLPATIRSRCQPAKLLMPSQDDGLPWLDQITGSRGESEMALELADGQIMLAATLSREAKIDAAAAQHAVLDDLVTGKAKVGDLALLMTEDSLEDILLALRRLLQRNILSMDATTLAGNMGRSNFGLLDEVVRLQRVVASGANPNRQLLIDSLSARFEMVLV